MVHMPGGSSLLGRIQRCFHGDSKPSQVDTEDWPLHLLMPALLFSEFIGIWSCLWIFKAEHVWGLSSRARKGGRWEAGGGGDFKESQADEKYFILFGQRPLGRESPAGTNAHTGTLGPKAQAHVQISTQAYRQTHTGRLVKTKDSGFWPQSHVMQNPYKSDVLLGIVMLQITILFSFSIPWTARVSHFVLTHSTSGCPVLVVF